MASSCTNDRTVAMAMSRSSPTPRSRETSTPTATNKTARATSPNPIWLPTFTVFGTALALYGPLACQKRSAWADFDDVVGQFGRVARLVRHHHDGQPGVGKAADQPLDAALRPGVEARRRLVQRQHVRL